MCKKSMKEILLNDINTSSGYWLCNLCDCVIKFGDREVINMYTKNVKDFLIPKMLASRDIKSLDSFNLPHIKDRLGDDELIFIYNRKLQELKYS